MNSEKWIDGLFSSWASNTCKKLQWTWFIPYYIINQQYYTSDTNYFNKINIIYYLKQYFQQMHFYFLRKRNILGYTIWIVNFRNSSYLDDIKLLLWFLNNHGGLYLIQKERKITTIYY